MLIVPTYFERRDIPTVPQADGEPISLPTAFEAQRAGVPDSHLDQAMTRDAAASSRSDRGFRWLPSHRSSDWLISMNGVPAIRSHGYYQASTPTPKTEKKRKRCRGGCDARLQGDHVGRCIPDSATGFNDRLKWQRKRKPNFNRAERELRRAVDALYRKTLAKAHADCQTNRNKGLNCGCDGMTGNARWVAGGDLAEGRTMWGGRRCTYKLYAHVGGGCAPFRARSR